MKTFIKDFPNHIENAIKIADKSVSKFNLNDISNVIISGQGGSSIAGCIVRNIFYNKISIPIIINQDYKIKSYNGDLVETHLDLIRLFDQKWEFVSEMETEIPFSTPTTYYNKFTYRSFNQVLVHATNLRIYLYLTMTKTNSISIQWRIWYEPAVNVKVYLMLRSCLQF